MLGHDREAELGRQLAEIKSEASELAADLRRALAEIERLRAPHTDRTVPCPKCGFVVVHRQSTPFQFDDASEQKAPAETAEQRIAREWLGRHPEFLRDDGQGAREEEKR